MTDLSRGARVRRGGRRPGWVLLTALLVLAIGASSALVFTNRVELLKLAVILALWAAVVAAFVSVIYRRQSDVDQARARDLKLVYDLQLDREISARREYELTVESQLRRELSSELRAHSADEVSALRAELAALRTNLEILFDAELSERPALETERRTVRGYSDWDRDHESARERVNRVTSVRAEEPQRVDDSSIIDVPEEPLVPPPRQPVADDYQATAYAYQPTGTPPPEADPGAQRRRGDRFARVQHDEATPPTGWPAQPQQTSESDGRVASGAPPVSGRHEPDPERRARRRQEATPPERPEPPPELQRPDRSPEPPRRRNSLPGWQPVTAEGQGSPAERRGRHSNVAEPGSQEGESEAGWRESVQRAQARHSADYSDDGLGASAPPTPAMSPPPPPAPPSPPTSPDREPTMSPPPAPQPAARHRSTDPLETDAPPSGGQSVAELLARLQTSPSGGGRRRRRED
jgi:hypothetical protein